MTHPCNVPLSRRWAQIQTSIPFSLPLAARRAQALEMVRAAQGQALTESAGKQLLALYGIPVTYERVVTSAAEAARAAQEIGFPIAMKIVSPQITHKTEAGGVVLNVARADEARAAFERIMHNARQY